MNTPVATAIAVTFGLVAIVMSAWQHRTRVQLDLTRAQLGRYQWVEWWQRNAAESTPLDPSRDWYVRLAWIAMLCPSLADFRRALADVEIDARAPENLRIAATAYLAELAAPAPPFEIWDREVARPRHNEAALTRELASLLRGERHPLGTDRPSLVSPR